MITFFINFYLFRWMNVVFAFAGLKLLIFIVFLFFFNFLIFYILYQKKKNIYVPFQVKIKNKKSLFFHLGITILYVFLLLGIFLYFCSQIGEEIPIWLGIAPENISLNCLLNLLLWIMVYQIYHGIHDLLKDSFLRIFILFHYFHFINNFFYSLWREKISFYIFLKQREREIKKLLIFWMGNQKYTFSYPEINCKSCERNLKFKYIQKDIHLSKIIYYFYRWIHQLIFINFVIYDIIFHHSHFKTLILYLPLFFLYNSWIQLSQFLKNTDKWLIQEIFFLNYFSFFSVEISYKENKFSKKKTPKSLYISSDPFFYWDSLSLSKKNITKILNFEVQRFQTFYFLKFKGRPLKNSLGMGDLKSLKNDLGNEIHPDRAYEHLEFYYDKFTQEKEKKIYLLCKENFAKIYHLYKKI